MTSEMLPGTIMTGLSASLSVSADLFCEKVCKLNRASNGDIDCEIWKKDHYCPLESFILLLAKNRKEIEFSEEAKKNGFGQ